MKFKSPNVLMGVTVVGCAVVISISLNYYSKDKVVGDKVVSGTTSVIEESTDVLWNPEPELSLGEGEEPSRVGEVSVPESLNKVETLETGLDNKASLIENDRSSIAVENERIAKLWFDIREGNRETKVLDDLLESFQNFLAYEEMPQIVDNFALQLLSDNEVGFSTKLIATGQGYINLITLVLPKDIENRVVTFYSYSVGETIYTGKFRGTNILPSYTGKQFHGESNYIFLGGDIIDQYLYTDNGSVGVYAIKITDRVVELVDLQDVVEDTLPSDLVYNGYNLEINGKNYGTVPFFYNEMENEGEATDDLFLILESDDASDVYMVHIGSKGFELTKTKLEEE